MPSNQDTKNDPHDVLEIAPDVVLVARAATEFPSLAPDTASQPFNRQPNTGNIGVPGDFAAAPRVDAAFRASDVNDIPGRRSRGRWIRTSSMGFLFAFASVIATAAWQRYGNDAQAMATNLTSQIDLSAWLPWQKSEAATPADSSTSSPAPAAAATAADQAAASASQPADSSAVPNAAAPAATTASQAPSAQDPAQTLQSVSRDVASLTQQIEALKASIAELKANQEQLSRDTAKTRATEARVPETKPAEPRPAKLGAPPRPLGTIVQHKPKPPMYPPPYPPTQATAAAPLPPPGVGSVPVQVAPGPPPADASDDGVVVRPPMPVR